MSSRLTIGIDFQGDAFLRHHRDCRTRLLANVCEFPREQVLSVWTLRTVYTLFDCDVVPDRERPRVGRLAHRWGFRTGVSVDVANESPNSSSWCVALTVWRHRRADHIWQNCWFTSEYGKALTISDREGWSTTFSVASP